jgi:hypothetical protein
MENTRMGRLREALRRSQAAVATMVVLYLWATTALVSAVEQSVHTFGPMVATAVAIVGAPTLSRGDLSLLRMKALMTCANLVELAVELTLAWVVAQWVYGTGPLRVLSAWSKPLLRRSHA